MTATIGILNVGAGDTKLVFDPKNPAECIRAARIVKDMIRRGYALLIEVGKDEKGDPKYQRALDFDEKHFEYIIADLDPEKAAAADRMQKELDDGPQIKRQAPAEAGEEAGPSDPAPAIKTGKRRGRPTKRIAATSASGVSVGRTAGG